MLVTFKSKTTIMKVYKPIEMKNIQLEISLKYKVYACVKSIYFDFIRTYHSKTMRKKERKEFVYENLKLIIDFRNMLIMK